MVTIASAVVEATTPFQVVVATITLRAAEDVTISLAVQATTKSMVDLISSTHCRTSPVYLAEVEQTYLVEVEQTYLVEGDFHWI
jgi:predicted DNA-binding protein